jgi:HEAT repeat protein
MLNSQDPVVVRALAAALQDPSRDVRAEAAQSLGNAGAAASEAVGALAAALEDADVRVRTAAASALGRIGPTPDAATALVQVLERSPPRVSLAAAEALRSRGLAGDEVVRALIGILADTDASVRTSAANALGEIGTPEAIGPLLAALANANLPAQERCRAADAVSRASSPLPQAITALIDALRGPNGQVQLSAAEALGRLGPGAGPDVVAALIVALRDPNRQVQLAAAKELGQIGPAGGPAAIDALMEALADEGLQVQAAPALVMQGAAAVAPLVEAMARGEGGLPWAAELALARIVPTCTERP